MDERLLAVVLVAPSNITMVGFAVAIAFAPAVPNEIAPATEHDHEAMDQLRVPDAIRLVKKPPQSHDRAGSNVL